jgi:hypothetical protein
MAHVVSDFPIQGNTPRINDDIFYVIFISCTTLKMNTKKYVKYFPHPSNSGRYKATPAMFLMIEFRVGRKNVRDYNL